MALAVAVAVAVTDSQHSSVSVALAVNWYCYDVLRGREIGRRGTRSCHMIYGQLDCCLTGWLVSLRCANSWLKALLAVLALCAWRVWNL